MADITVCPFASSTDFAERTAYMNCVLKREPSGPFMESFYRMIGIAPAAQDPYAFHNWGSWVIAFFALWILGTYIWIRGSDARYYWYSPWVIALFMLKLSLLFLFLGITILLGLGLTGEGLVIAAATYFAGKQYLNRRG